MGFLFEERASDSPFIASVTRGRTVGYGAVIRPAERHWHMVLARFQGSAQLFVVGPLTSAGVVPFIEGAEILWIKFALGTFMPHLPIRHYLNVETALPGAACQSFWLRGSTWQLPTFENVETFVGRLARDETLARDPIIETMLRDEHYEPHDLAPRTVRHRFLRATGLTRSQIRAIERAQRAADLLRQGTPILETVHTAGYFDQPHLTRSLKQWVGHTPAQLLRSGASPEAIGAHR